MQGWAFGFFVWSDGGERDGGLMWYKVPDALKCGVVFSEPPGATSRRWSYFLFPSCITAVYSSLALYSIIVQLITLSISRECTDDQIHSLRGHVKDQRSHGPTGLRASLCDRMTTQSCTFADLSTFRPSDEQLSKGSS